MQEGLLSFKYLEEEHDGLSLCKAMMEVLEDWQDDWVESVMDYFNSAFVFYKAKLNQTPQSTAASSPIQEEKKANVSQLFTKHLKRKRANPSNLEEEHVR